MMHQRVSLIAIALALHRPASSLPRSVAPHRSAPILRSGAHGGECAPALARRAAAQRACPAPARRDAAQHSRRSALGALGALAVAAVSCAPGRADAGANPANNYYFPMAKYRYLPRINRAYLSLADLSSADKEAIDRFAAGDWSALSTIYANADDATTALALYANSVEGSRSSKGKRKSPRQKELYAFVDAYKAGVERLGKAVKAKSSADVLGAVSLSLAALQGYKDLADINGPNGAARARGRLAQARLTPLAHAHASWAATPLAHVPLSARIRARSDASGRAHRPAEVHCSLQGRRLQEQPGKRKGHHPAALTSGDGGRHGCQVVVSALSSDCY